MLIQLALRTDMAGQLINMISNTQYAVPATPPSAPTPATSLLPSTPSPFTPLSMDPALTTPLTVVPPSQADHPPMHIVRVWARARVRVKRANLSVNPRGPISLCYSPSFITSRLFVLVLTSHSSSVGTTLLRLVPLHVPRRVHFLFSFPLVTDLTLFSELPTGRGLIFFAYLSC
jgi:hypothetical protein